MIDKCINKQISNATFNQYSDKVGIVLSGGTSFGPNYDPYRKTGYIKTKKNPIWVKALKKTLTAESLICRSLGLKEIGAVSLTVKDCDVNLFKMAERVLIDGIDYTIYNDALGNRFQIFPIKFGFSKIVVFKDTKSGKS